jgi:hypothetical protein
MPIDQVIIDGRNDDDLGRAQAPIVWMYYDLITSYGRIGHGIDFEQVDYRRLLLVTSASDEYAPLAGFLQRGATIAFCCDLCNALDEEQRPPALLSFVEDVVQSASGASDATKALAQAAKAALEEPLDAAWETLPQGSRLSSVMEACYDECVLGFVDELVHHSRRRTPAA